MVALAPHRGPARQPQQSLDRTLGVAADLVFALLWKGYDLGLQTLALDMM